MTASAIILFYDLILIESSAYIMSIMLPSFSDIWKKLHLWLPSHCIYYLFKKMYQNTLINVKYFV